MMVTNILKKFVCLISFLFLLFACKEDDSYSIGNETGKPSVLTLRFTTQSALTRAVQSDAQEKKLFNLYIMLFDTSGKKVYGEFKELDEEDQNAPIIQIQALSGDHQTLVALANIESSIMSVKKDELDNIQQLDDLEKTVLTLQQNVIERAEYFLMISRNLIDIKSDGINEQQIALSRTDAKIKFNFKAKEGVSLTPFRWRIVNVSKQTKIFEDDVPLENQDSDKYFTTIWNNFEGLFDEAGSTFAFYLLENIQKPKKLIPEDVSEVNREGMSEETYRYALREKQEKILKQTKGTAPTHINGDFVYAPHNGTYVELEGRITYKNEEGKDVNAEVNYKIHLGYIGKDVNDYNVKRNSNYTYTVTINSVNNILVEAEDDNEIYPGAEGVVTISTKQIQLDSHYESFVISFTKDQITGGLSWFVSTPFSVGSSSDKQIPEDYKWVYYRINTHENGIYSHNLRAYPGEQEIYSGDVDYDTYLEDVKQGTDKLLNTDQLLKILEITKSRQMEGNNENLSILGSTINFTVFVNEFYYAKSPINGDQTEEIDLWKKFVNTYDRQIGLVQTVAYSPDGNSIKRKVIYVLSQASIQTIYTVKSSDSYSAWGSEKFQKLDLFKPDQTYLRQNSITMMIIMGEKIP